MCYAFLHNKKLKGPLFQIGLQWNFCLNFQTQPTNQAAQFWSRTSVQVSGTNFCMVQVSWVCGTSISFSCTNSCTIQIECSSLFGAGNIYVTMSCMWPTLFSVLLFFCWYLKEALNACAIYPTLAGDELRWSTDPPCKNVASGTKNLQCEQYFFCKCSVFLLLKEALNVCATFGLLLSL